MSALDRLATVDHEDDGLPSMEEVEARFAASRHGPLPPWLTPEGLAAMAEAVASGIPELSGPVDKADPLADLPDRDD